jgi:hypothetical protein
MLKQAHKKKAFPDNTLIRLKRAFRYIGKPFDLWAVDGSRSNSDQPPGQFEWTACLIRTGGSIMVPVF